MKKIDMHCHILPGIDDGSANPKETLTMLRMALKQDFVGMIVTPHGSVQNASTERVEEIRILIKKFRIQAYQRLGIRLPVFPGQEIMYSVDTRQLLKEGKYTVSEISFMVGYNTPSYFAARFKKYIGCLPTEYGKK